jgi:hypothetical protein
MDYEHAAQAAVILKPSYAVPMHFGKEVSGSQEDGKRFCQLVNGNINAIELEVENPFYVR